MTQIWLCMRCKKELTLEVPGKPVKCSCGSYRFKKALRVGRFVDKMPKGANK